MSWSWVHRVAGTGARTKRGRPTRHHVRLSLETLEDRLAPSVSVLGSFNGMSNTGYSQPNTSVAAGPNYVVETVNSSIAIYNKATGALVSQETLATLFNGLVTGDSGQFDPSVLYDDQAGRFVVAAQVYNSANQTSFVDIAVSSSSDPTQGFAQIHQIEVDDGWHYWSDNGKLGFNADAYVFSGNLAWFTQNGQYDDVVVTINKNSVLGQNNSTFTDSVTYLTGYASLVPARMHGSAPGGPMWLVETCPGGSSTITVTRMDNVLSAEPTFTDFLVPVNSYTEAQTNPLQPGGTIGADDCRALNVEWNNNNLVTAFNGGVGSDAAADWVEFSTSGSSPALVQQGDIHPAPGTAAYMPSIAVDALGDLGVTYMQSSATQYVSMYVTGRLASDPLGTLEAPALVAPGTSTMTNRVGDWSGISLDPSSPNTFWAGNEYGANFWSTWLCQFQLTASGTGNPPTVASPATAAPKPVAGTTTMLSVLGADASGESSLTYTWSLLSGPAGAPVPTFSANGTNAAKNTTVSFYQSGNYTFQVTITDPSGLTVTSSASVTVNQTLTGVTVTPGNATLSNGATQQFRAVALDQFGQVLATQPTFTWSDPGTIPGSISASGLYAAPSSGTGTDTVYATAGGITGTAAVTITARPPVITQAACSSQNPVTGTQTSLQFQASDPNGASLTYSWSVTGQPASARTPTFDNASSSQPKATFYQAGSYTFVVTVTDSLGLSASSSVTVSVVQTAKSISISPTNARVGQGGTVTFAAASLDQFGNAMSVQPSLTWQASGGTLTSTMGSNVTFVAGSPGNAQVKVSASNCRAQANITVTPTPAAPIVTQAASARAPRSRELALHCK